MGALRIIGSLLLTALVGSACLQTSQQTGPDLATLAPQYVRFADAELLSARLRNDAEEGPLVSAHRGGPEPGFPENCLETFQNTLKYGPAVLECDVRLTRDGHLVLLHDDNLDRTTTGRGPLANETLDVVRTLRLRDNDGKRTPYSIPTLAEALAWAEGRAILTLDIKRGTPPQIVVDEIQRAKAHNRVTVIVYTFGDLMAYHNLDKSLNIAGSARSVEDVQQIIAAGVPPKRLTVFTGVGRLNETLVKELARHRVRAIMGTFGELDERAAKEGPRVYQELFAKGLGMVATDNPAAAGKALREMVRRAPALR